MVEVRVRQKDGVDLTGIFDDGVPVFPSFSAFLNHPAIDEKLIIVANDVVLGPRDVSGCAAELKFHVNFSLLFRKAFAFLKTRLERTEAQGSFADALIVR